MIKAHACVGALRLIGTCLVLLILCPTLLPEKSLACSGMVCWEGRMVVFGFGRCIRELYIASY